MLSDAIKLFEILLRQFDKDVEIGKGFQNDWIEPLYASLRLIHEDYEQLYRDVQSLFVSLPGHQRSGKLKAFFEERRAVRDLTRKEVISISQRLSYGSAFKKLRPKQQDAVSRFCEAAQAVFQLDPVGEMRSGGSYYSALIGVRLASELQIDPGPWQSVLDDYYGSTGSFDIPAHARRLHANLDQRWIQLTDAYASCKSELS